MAVDVYDSVYKNVGCVINDVDEIRIVWGD